MRRQARLSVGGALVVRSASALQVWLWLLIFIFQNEFRISRSIQPGYLDFDNLPETNFTCAGKVIGGYYADLETSCQMFHVCTVGQQEEPMDIKFLCLNGTVFDQETRVCERVDEVDCTKSEKFYSLNLELYGSTLAPPVNQADQNKPQAESTEQSSQHKKPSHNSPEATLSGTASISRDKTTEHSTDAIDATDDPIQNIKKDEHSHKLGSSSTHPSLPLQEEFEEEYEDEIDSENPDYEDYSHSATTTKTTTVQAPTTTISTTTAATTVSKPSASTALPSSTSAYLPPINHFFSSPVPTKSTITPSSPPPSSSASSSQSLDPALLSPQEFIYHHRGPGADAISFQRQSFRPADGVYITHAPQQQFDHFQYELSRTAPRPAQSRPAPFVHRPQPFRPTTVDPRDQLLRPGPTSQSSERHEMTVKHRSQPYPSILPAQRPLPFNPYYYDRKRSDDALPENQSSLSARSVAPPTTTQKVPPPPKPKSPPRVIVTASASVSDSNGKRLNYTVGNVVSAVKPIVPINYDDYKESDLIFDPFFLDVPKLQKRRKSRSNINRKIIAVDAPATIAADLAEKRRFTTASPVTSQATTTEKSTTKSTTTTTTPAWNPDDYVDDNYEPQAYQIAPVPPIAVLIAHDQPKHKKEEKLIINSLGDQKTFRLRSKINRLEQSRPTPSAEQKISSHIAGAIAPQPQPPPALSLPLPPKAAHSCALLHSVDCLTRA